LRIWNKIPAIFDLRSCKIPGFCVVEG
jgi:hypothetical protein